MKIIFLSEEDICRGPMAEGIMKATLPMQSGFTILSRGRMQSIPLWSLKEGV